MEEESAGKEAKTVPENVEERASAKRIGIPILQAAPTVETQKTETVPIVTGEVEEKRIKLSEVHQDIERLRKLSQDSVEMERQKSVETAMALCFPTTTTMILTSRTPPFRSPERTVFVRISVIPKNRLRHIYLSSWHSLLFRHSIDSTFVAKHTGEEWIPEIRV